ncbi:MAG TPA: M14 family metallopeptidase [Vicinamibacterales bacterium]|nr:M14 family metallopeptidase [Vicinamibacterales bacterium]
MLQDRNGDGVTDFVNATFVLPDTPSADDIAAAADIAARLGHETLAMNLPVARSGGEGVLIAIGAGGLARAGAPAASSSALKPGQGSVAVVNAGGRTVVAVTGADAAGTRAAAEAFAAQLPSAGTPGGPTLGDLVGDVKKALDAASVSPASVHVARVIASRGHDGLDRVVVEASFARSADVAAARRALRALRPAGTNDKPALSYEGTRVLEVQLTAPGAPRATAVLEQVKAAEDQDEPPARRPGGGAKDALDLSSLYANAGLLGDSDNNLIPDRVDAVLSAAGDGTVRTIDVAARLGLESTGVSIPLVVPPDALGKPESQPTLVLIGASHPLVQQLEKDGKFHAPQLQAGEGAIQIVKKAFGEKSAVVVVGADAAGLDRALAQLAERLPHIWARGKDRTTIDDVEEEARRFLGGRTPGGQAALAMYKVKQVAGELSDAGLESARVFVSVDKAQPGLADVLKKEAAAALKLPSVDVTVENRDVQHAKTIFDDEFDIPSEVDVLRARIREKVIPAVSRRKKQPVVVEARVSEPPELRRQLEQEIRDEILKAGASEASVRVLSAYKQGFSWLDEVVKPAVAGKPIDRITIRFAKVGPPAEWKQQATYAPTRWLLEIYPIAEVLARDLKIDVNRIAFEEAPIDAPPYEVTVTGTGGAQLYHGTFAPKFVLRQFFDQFVDYEKVRITTGWLDARVGQTSVADERIPTDPETFWDHFQGKTLRDIYAYVMRVHDGRPRAEDAPFFGELKVDVTLSEPDYALGIEQEHIASMESIQEEIYFNTLHYFDVLGRYTRSDDLSYPGRVIPFVHPKADGKSGHARITFTGFDAPRPIVVVSYTARGGKQGEIRRDIPKIAVERPEALGAIVRAGRDGLERLDLRVKVDTEHDERADLVLKAREEQVDRQILSADQVKAVVGNLEALRAAGLYRETLAYHDLGGIRIDAGWTFDADPKTTVTASLDPNGQPAPWPDIRKRLPSGYAYHGERLVQWDEPIPPDEAYEILAKMSTFKEATVYKVGESYLGREIWAMDLMPPIEASHWSQAKATTLKPTVIYSARQHANEVSSTSHTLRLAEQLLTDPAQRKKLNVVNAVFHPITNPDGAQLAYDLQKITPTYMLHPGYLGALGVDATSGGFDQDPIYPESKVRPEIWRMWLPDIFLNPHGYPTHEWVQLFSEYAAWIRSRIGESRDYWTMRGWWMPGFGYVDDPKYPRNKEAQFSLRQFITERINAVPEVKALNDRSYERYRRYTAAFDPKLFKLNFTNGVLIYSSIKGAKGSPSSRGFMTRQPNITIFDGSTEAPDETAHGDWMKLVATAGLTWDTAMLDWLAAQPHHIDRTSRAFAGGVSLSMNRPRPPKPAKDDKTKTRTTEVGGIER